MPQSQSILELYIICVRESEKGGSELTQLRALFNLHFHTFNIFIEMIKNFWWEFLHTFNLMLIFFAGKIKN